MLKIQTPNEIYGDLFDAVQMGHVFPDSKTFVDSIPRFDPETIVEDYLREHNGVGFDLAAFFKRNFELPALVDAYFEADPNRPVREHIDLLWDVLERKADSHETHSSLISLPRPYIVPGGRFREIYYWDSYFTMLGLAAAGRVEMIENMVANFAFLIDKIGHIPNGNRTYYSSRSQQPFFALMVELLADAKKDDHVYGRFLKELELEYEFWMADAKLLKVNHTAVRHVVSVDDNYLNRFWDDSELPRQESHLEDVELAEASARDPEEIYRDIRAAAESGWDFSARWFEDPNDMATIRASQIVPIDLNTLMYKLECVLAKGFGITGNIPQQTLYQERADARKTLIQSLFFDQDQGFFVDLLLPDLGSTGALSVAAAYPLFFNIATPEQAGLVAERLRADFLKAGGWLTTCNHTGQQWDAPNGWAPMQWMVYVGLCNYGYEADAREGAARWVANNLDVYQKTGNLVEKYDVEHIGVLAGGGEYEVQTGFGWTNGVLLKFLDELDL